MNESDGKKKTAKVRVMVRNVTSKHKRIPTSTERLVLLGSILQVNRTVPRSAYCRKAYPLHVPTVLKSGSLNLLEPSGLTTPVMLRILC